MTRHLTLYVKNQTVEENMKNYSGLVHAWSSNPILEAHNIIIGDTIYLVTIQKGVLFVISALTIGDILSYADFSRKYGKDLADGWEHGNIFYLASRATTIEINRNVSFTDAKRLRFHGKKDKLAFKSPESELLDPQTLRTPRKLTEDSASILDSYLGKLIDKMQESHITDWRRVLPKEY